MWLSYWDKSLIMMRYPPRELRGMGDGVGFSNDAEMWGKGIRGPPIIM